MIVSIQITERGQGEVQNGKNKINFRGRKLKTVWITQRPDLSHKNNTKGMFEVGKAEGGVEESSVVQL